MAESKPFVRTVAFFRLVKEVSLEGFPSRNWQNVLQTIHDDKVRLFPINGRDVDGEVFLQGKRLCLRLSNDRITAPRQRHTTTRERQPMRVRGADWEPTEECFIEFFEHNVFGMVSTNTSAPSHSTVARWLNWALNYQDSYRVKAVPMVNKQQWERLHEMRGVSVASVSLRPKDVEPSGSRILEYLWGAGRELGSNLRVELRISIERGAGNEEQRQRLLGESEAVLTELQNTPGLGVEKAEVRGKPDDGGPMEKIDLIEASFTRRTEIELTGTALDRSLNDYNAVEAVREAYTELRDALMTAIAADLEN